MLESKAYQTYYAFASGEKAPKPKYIRKKADSDTSPKKKPQPEKKTKAKGLDVLSEVVLTEAEQIKLVTKRSKKDFHVSQASGLGDGVDTQSKVPDEQQPKTSGTNEGTGAIPGVLDVPPYKSESDKDSWGDSEDEDNDDDDGDNDDDGNSDNHDDDSDDERTESDRDELDDEETMDDEEDDEVIKELYDDVNQEEEDAHVTLTPVIEAHKADEPIQSSSVSSDFTSKLLNLENPSPVDNEIASLLETSAHHETAIPEITYGFTTTTPPPTPFFNPLLQQQTPTFTTTTSKNPTVTLPKIPNFASVFKFDQRVSVLESKMSESKQTNQFAEAVSSILGIVDKYLASKMKEVVDVVVQLQTNKLRKEAQAKNQEFLNQVDSTMKIIIKDQVTAQVSKITPKIEKYVTESLGDAVLVRSTNQPQTAYAVAASLSEFKLKKILIDKMETNKSINRSDNQKNLYNALVESYNSEKYIITSYGDVVLLKRGRDDQDKDEDSFARSNRGTKRRKSGKDVESSKYSRSKENKSSSTSKDASQSQHKSSSKFVHVEEPSYTIEDSGMQQDQEFITGDNDEQPTDKEVTKVDWFKKPERPPTPDPDWKPPTSFDEFNDTSFDFSAFVLNRLKIPNLTQEIRVGPAFNLLKGTCKSITELEYHLEECSKSTTERLDWHNWPASIGFECGVNLLLETCLNCTYGDGKPVTCCGCEGPLRGGFCSFCASRDGNSFDYNPNPNSFNESKIFPTTLHNPVFSFCEKLLNVNLLADKIEALKLTPSIPFVLENPSSFPIPVVDSYFLIEEVDTFLVSEDSIPPGIESDLDSEGDIVFLDNLLNDDPIPKYERFTFDIEPYAPVINNFDELNEDECFDPRGGEIDVEDDDSFTFVIRTFLPFLTYLVDSPLLLFTGSEDNIFDPGIST
ncbi:hypothetical protein Tco_0865812 [Tanacetum coccineum]